jgi:hypothetical protein
MNRRQQLDLILKQEYEDHCEHQRVALVTPILGSVFDIEGGTMRTECLQCGTVLETGRIYE